MDTECNSPKLRKLLKQISKSELQIERLNCYVKNSRTVILPDGAGSEPRKRKLSKLVYFNPERDDIFGDQPPNNCANISLRKSYIKNRNALSRSLTSNSTLGGGEVRPEDKATPSQTTLITDSGLKDNGAEHSTPKISNLLYDVVDPVQFRYVKRCTTKDPPKKNEKDVASIVYPSVTFSDIGGLDNTLNEIAMMIACLKDPELFQAFAKWNPVENFLLQGPSGCGKSLIVHAICGEFQLPLIKVSATEIVSGISGESEKGLRAVFDKAFLNMPCILFIDEIDAIVPKRETADRDVSKRIVTQLVSCMDELKAKNAYVIVIGATNRPHALDSALRAAGRFDQEFHIGIPDVKARLQILKVFCNELTLSPEFNLEWLVENTPGYVGADLKAVCRQAVKNAVQRVYLDLTSKKSESTTLTSLPYKTLKSLWIDKHPQSDEKVSYVLEKQDFDSALKSYTPSTKREGFPNIPGVTWEEVGAMNDVKKELEEAIIWPVKYKEEFKKCFIESCSGILLCGPKGCGKTLIAQAVANECRVNFLSVKGPELLNMYLGESERAVRECFEKARRAAPCVIFFDELDALCPVRSAHGNNPAANSIVCMMLTEIDGIKEKEQQIFVMGTTNRPHDIDSAMLRPGRLERIIYVGAPSKLDRYDILCTITKKGTRPKLADDVSLEKLSIDSRCEGFSGADLASLVRQASLLAFREHVQDSETSEYEIKLKHFESAFTVVEPSISERDLECFKGLKSASFKRQHAEQMQTGVKLSC